MYQRSNLAIEYVGCRQPLLLPVARDGVQTRRFVDCSRDMAFIRCRVCVQRAGGDTTQEGRLAVSEVPDFMQSRYGIAEFHNRAIELSGRIYLTIDDVCRYRIS